MTYWLISCTGLYAWLTIVQKEFYNVPLQILPAAIWTHTALYSFYACAIIGRVCTPISIRFMLHAQDVPLLTPWKENHPNWCIISPSKLHSGRCTWMPLQPAHTPALKAPPPTSLVAVVCALLGSWNQLLVPLLLPLHPPSWSCNYALDSAMPLF